MTLAPETDVPATQGTVGQTFLPRYDDDAAPAVPRASLGRLTVDEKFVRIGSVASGLGLAWLITQRLLPLDGLPWFLVIWLAGDPGGHRGHRCDDRRCRRGPRPARRDGR